jgi:hypothetical protein
MKILNLIIMTGLFSWFFSCKENTTSKPAADKQFKAGQIWKYKTRKGEENSTLTILKIEQYDSTGQVVHIALGGLRIKNTRIKGGFSEEVGHLPLSQQALQKSVTTLVSENNTLPDFAEGYGHWKEAFDKHEGGIFSIEVSEAVRYLEEVMNNSK